MRKLLIAGSSIAMSWMWGLGLFFSVHFTYQYGWIGLLCFAVPNALGLVFFGWVLARRAVDVDLKTWSERAFARYAPVFALYQVGAVALTLFALMAYFLAPLGIAYAAFAGSRRTRHRRAPWRNRRISPADGPSRHLLRGCPDCGGVAAGSCTT